MLTQQKIDAVKKQVRSGIPEGEIKNELRNEGFTEAEISKIFEPKPYDMRSWYLFFGVLLVIAGAYIILVYQVWLPLLLGVVLLTLYYNDNQKRSKQSSKE